MHCMATTADPSTQTTEDLKAIVLAALEDAKANDVRQLDVRRLTDVTDWMVVASGTSTPVSYTHLTLPTTPYV